jgi:CTP synthase
MTPAHNARKRVIGTKYIFVTGGVVSSLGKGIASASIGCLLEHRGFTVGLQKLDPYLNVDPGTMSPYQHGEVFVTDDGAETDLDLGHYERFTAHRTSKASNFTTGQIYETILKKERKGDYLGKTVQVVPHVTEEIKYAIESASQDNDILIVEVGGTVGDIESLPFLEAIRQFRYEVGPSNALFIHLTLVPYIAVAKELKTKPTQHTVRDLRAIGIQPDALLCRVDRPLPVELKAKIALFCNVSPEAVITAQDVESIYEVPLKLHEEGLDSIITKELNLPPSHANLSEWETMVHEIKHPRDEVVIGVVGKYVGYEDSYKSLNEALAHGGFAHKLRTRLEWVDAEALGDGNTAEALKHVDGILVPGGFGERGIEGKIRAIRYARERKVPFFGICLGAQCAVIEFARNVCGLQGANSTEFDENTAHKLVFKLRDLLGVEDMGGTMRLGAYACRLEKSSLAETVYEAPEISERHRHRYECNPEFVPRLREAGLRFSGMSPDGKFVEIVEIPDHPWFLGCQFHPEFKSRPLVPQPLFASFIGAAYEHRAKRKA